MVATDYGVEGMPKVTKRVIATRGSFFLAYLCEGKYCYVLKRVT
jgi:hypothetical protein